MAKEPDKKAEPEKRSVSIKDQIVTTAQLADWARMSINTVEQYASRNVFIRVARGQFMLKASIGNYIDGLSKSASGRGSKGEDARARQSLANAEIAEAKLKQMRGEYVPASEVEQEWSSRFSNIRTGLLGFTQRLSGLLPHLSRADLALIDHEMRQTLSDIANGKFDL